jgi:hypothetical protein
MEYTDGLFCLGQAIIIGISEQVDSLHGSTGSPRTESTTYRSS